jgi:hypothetical protein
MAAGDAPLIENILFFIRAKIMLNLAKKILTVLSDPLYNKFINEARPLQKLNSGTAPINNKEVAHATKLLRRVIVPSLHSRPSDGQS